MPEPEGRMAEVPPSVGCGPQARTPAVQTLGREGLRLRPPGVSPGALT